MQQLVQIGQMLAEELLEITDGARRIVVAKPPEPVGSLAHGQLAISAFPLIGRQSGADTPIASDTDTSTDG